MGSYHNQVGRGNNSLDTFPYKIIGMKNIQTANTRPFPPLGVLNTRQTMNTSS